MERQLAQLQGQLKQYEDVMQHLQSASEHDALETIRQIRSTPNLESVLSFIKSSIVPKCLSDIEAAYTRLPFTQSGLEFELGVLHRNAYPALADIDPSTINASSRFRQRTSRGLPYTATNTLLDNYNISPAKGFIRGPPSPLCGTSSRSKSPLLDPL